MDVMYFVQSVLAGQRHSEDEPAWLQLLIFIIIAVMYALGGILKKANDNKIKLEDDEEIEKAIAQKKQDLQRKFTAQKQKIIEQKEKIKAAGKAYQRPQRIQQPKKSPKVESQKAPSKYPKVYVEQQEPVLAQLIEQADESAKMIEPTSPLIDQKDINAEKPIGIQINESPFDLKTAVMYFEIFGKPVSMRNPEDKFMS